MVLVLVIDTPITTIVAYPEPLQQPPIATSRYYLSCQIKLNQLSKIQTKNEEAQSAER